MRWPSRAAALAVVIVLVPACKGMGGPFQGFFSPFPNTVANGTLRGSQVIPALGTGAAGTATITVDGLRTFIDYTIDATGIATAVTAIEIRSGGPGTNGPVLLTIPLGAFPLSGRLTPATMIPPMLSTTFAAAGDAIANGQTYLLISSTAQPTGEIRAHLGQAALASAVLSGSQELPPLGLPATGTATVGLDDAQATLTVTLTIAGLSSAVTSAQIFDGAPGNAGTTPLFDLATTAFSGSVTVRLQSGDFTASAGVTTFADAVVALLSGGLFIQVKTITNATGEIRGQVGPTQMTAVLTAGDVVPANSSTATGAATIALNAAQTAFFITLTHNVVTPTAVTIHADDPGSNGPQIFDVDAIAGAATSPVSATLTSLQLIPQPSKGISTFTDVVNALLTAKTYVDVGSTGFPAGEIRGQILP